MLIFHLLFLNNAFIGNTAKVAMSSLLKSDHSPRPVQNRAIQRLLPACSPPDYPRDAGAAGLAKAEIASFALLPFFSCSGAFSSTAS